MNLRLKLSAAFAIVAAMAFAADHLDAVDTLIGGSYRGHTFPGATCPFSLGMIHASTDFPRRT